MKKTPFLCGLLRENGRIIVCLFQKTFPFSPNALAGSSIIVVHWRYYPRQTQLDSFEALIETISGGEAGAYPISGAIVNGLPGGSVFLAREDEV